MTTDTGVSPSTVPATLRRARRDDIESVTRLLIANNLPIVGVSEALDYFLVAEANGNVVGTTGLEMFGADALLRSAVVSESVRSTGVGTALIRGILALAEESDIRAVYLLTMTAERYFPRFGFVQITRRDVPEAVQESAEFKGACPASAIVMRRILDRPEVPI